MIGLLSGDDDYPMCRRPLALAVGNVKSAQYKNSSYRDILQFKFYELPLAFSLTKNGSGFVPLAQIQARS